MKMLRCSKNGTGRGVGGKVSRSKTKMESQTSQKPSVWIVEGRSIAAKHVYRGPLRSQIVGLERQFVRSLEPSHLGQAYREDSMQITVSRASEAARRLPAYWFCKD